MQSLGRIAEFQQYIWQFYADNGRVFAWRNNQNPYHIFISEVMLQQTQTHRVEKKFQEWIVAFPTFYDLAAASTRELLSVWQGLGYNRRALYVQQSAQRVVAEFGGQLPTDPAVLVTFPGIGKATAASICAFAFNVPTVFIETNIRSVFIDSFFRDQESVHDSEIMPLIAATVDHNNPREWYYALMDYGVFLKKHKVNPSKKSAHYAVQSRFEGSDRQIRGEILRLLTKKETLTVQELVVLTQKDPIRVEKIIKKLHQEGFLAEHNGLVRLG
jgi:A/G-specific adenine glycosylase